MAEEHSGTIDERDHGETTAQWRRTLWAMVGIQFINTMAFSVLSPIRPLFLPVLGRNGECCRSVVRHPQRRHLPHRGLCLAALGPCRRPPRPQADADPLDMRDRRVYRADGLGGKYLAILCVSRADGGVRRLLQRGNRACGEPGPRRAARLCAGLAQHRPARWFAGGSADRRSIGRFDRSYRIPFYCTSATILMSTGLVWITVRERFVALSQTRGGRSILGNRGGPFAGPSRSVLCAADGAVRRADRPAGRDIIRPRAGRRATRSRDFERHRLLGDRAFRCHRRTLSRQTGAT